MSTKADKRATVEMAARLGDSFFGEITPRFALVHARTGNVAGSGKTKAAAVRDALSYHEIKMGRDWRVEMWRASMGARLMERES